MTRLMCGLVLLMLVAAAGSAAAPPIVEHDLGRSVIVRLNGDGRLEVGTYSGYTWHPMLCVLWPDPAPLWREPPTPFRATVRRAHPGAVGEVGPEADEGAAGPVDQALPENREGGAGGIFECDRSSADAALPEETGPPNSHLVGIWDLALGERGRRVETHHWDHEHLSSLTVAVFDQRGGGIVEHLRLSLLVPGAWTPLAEICPPLQHLPDMQQYLANIADPRRGEPPIWVGVALLDQQSRPCSEKRVRINRADLVVPLLDAQQVLVLAAGPTRLRVLEDLREAIGLHEGDVDPDTGRRVRWTSATRSGALSVDPLPAARLRPEAHGRFSLVFEVHAEQARFWDPDLFRLDGQVLGPADTLVWIDATGRRVSTAWSGDGAGLGTPCLPYEALGARGAGTLVINFAGPLPFGDVESDDLLLEAIHQDGRRGAFPAVLDARRTPVAAAEEVRAASDSRRPQLSPALLISSPNPFQTATRISFQVPATMGEAFVQEEGRGPVIDPQQRMPYADGAASVMVTVYNLEGRELTTLFAGLAGVGVYETSWDGRDREGRTQASGTYFCRLQIDNWSVTRRLIFIR